MEQAADVYPADDRSIPFLTLPVEALAFGRDRATRTRGQAEDAAQKHTSPSRSTVNVLL
jgi:hypothetical protein